LWSPHDYDDKFEGNITLLHALAESRNVPAVRLIAKIGVDKVIKLCRKFGITSRLVPNLPLALGASDLTLLEHTSAFTTFPDDGVHIAPRMMSRVTNYDGRVMDDFPPEVTDVIPAPVARLMVSMLREVFNSGTAARAKPFAAKYPVAGKTGTTNDFSDAWFIGFSPSLTCGVYVGFDDHHSLGNKEEGSHVALPIWQDFMGEVLKDRPVEDFPHSPLLTSPEQVKEILASAAPESLLAQRSPASGAVGNQPASAKAGPAPGVAPLAPNSETTSAPAKAQTNAGGSASPSRKAGPAAVPAGIKSSDETAPDTYKPSAKPASEKPAATPAPVAKANSTPPTR